MNGKIFVVYCNECDLGLGRMTRHVFYDRARREEWIILHHETTGHWDYTRLLAPNADRYEARYAR